MRRILILATLVIAVGAAWQFLGLGDYLNFESLKARQAELAAYVEANLWQSAIAFVALYILITAASLPGAAVMSLAGGALFGLALGTPLVLVAATIGASLAFVLSRYVLSGWVRQTFAKRLKKIDQGIEKDGHFYLFGLRLVPLFPFFLINLAMGLTKLPLRSFFWVSLLGMAPGTLVYVNAGTQLASIESASDVLSARVLLAFALLGVLPLLLRWLWRFIESRKVLSGFQKPDQFDYNVAVIGAGAGGLVASYLVNALGGKAVIIERGQMGGDCLNTGCVPSKALIHAARTAATVRDGAELGVAATIEKVDFKKIMHHVHGAIARIAPHDSTARYRDMGVDVVHGDATITSPWQVQVGEKTINAKKIVIASGSRPFVPPIPGLDAVDYLTSDTLWDLQALPAKLAIIGGGAIGCELAQAFSRLGSEVHLIEANSGILGHSDADAVKIVQQSLLHDGVTIATNSKVHRVEPGKVHCETENGALEIEFDKLLVAVGRQSVTDGLGLKALGVALNPHGAIITDAALRTNIPTIYAAGDVNGQYPFTHMAGYQGSVAGINALLGAVYQKKPDYKAVPAVVYTDPELAQVGQTEAQLQNADIAFEVTRFDMAMLDRAVTEAAGEGFIKVLTEPSKGHILGVTVVGQHAGELIDTYTRLIQSGAKLSKLQEAIVAYPTWADAANRSAGAWRQAHKPEKVLNWAKWWFQRGLK